MTRFIQPKSRTFLIAATLATSTIFGGFAVAADRGVAASGGAATGITGNGSMSDAARTSFVHGALPAGSGGRPTRKAAADAVYDRAASRLLASSASMIDLAAGGTQAAQKKRRVSVLASFAGQSDPNGRRPIRRAPVGLTRYVQLVNRRFAIYTKAGGLLSAGTLNQLAGFGAGVNSFDPQIIWDPTTNRFYYAMDSIVSSTDNRLAFGFSKSASPNSSADWCKYFINSGVEFPDFPKLGDSPALHPDRRQPVQSELHPFGSLHGHQAGEWNDHHLSSFASLNSRVFWNLTDPAGNRVFSPTPANSIDTFAFGYVIARNLSVPSNKIWNIRSRATPPRACRRSSSPARSRCRPTTRCPERRQPR